MGKYGKIMKSNEKKLFKPKGDLSNDLFAIIVHSLKICSLKLLLQGLAKNSNFLTNTHKKPKSLAAKLCSTITSFVYMIQYQQNKNKPKTRSGHLWLASLHNISTMSEMTRRRDSRDSNRERERETKPIVINTVLSAAM